MTPPFTLLRPHEQLSPVVFCSPQSGRIYPKVFLEASRLDAHTLRKSEDCYVDELFEPVVALGAPLIAARFPRAYLDVNREPYELDPELFTGRVPEFANTQSARVVGGLGTIARIVADTEEIYRERLPIGAAFERIERLYRPFHAALAELLETTRKRFGIAVLIDCHSMPSATIGQAPGGRPHFVLGDRFGASCDAKLTRFIRDTLQGAGYDVQVNRPYAGGFITEYYGNPGARRAVAAAGGEPRPLSRRGQPCQEQGLPETGAHPHRHGGKGVRGAANAARDGGRRPNDGASDRLGEPSRYIASQYGEAAPAHGHIADDGSMGTLLYKF